jgi:hypothetical protein
MKVSYEWEIALLFFNSVILNLDLETVFLDGPLNEELYLQTLFQ